MAMVLGIHLIGQTIVFVALQSCRPSWVNFMLVLQQYPTSVALAAVAGAWLLTKVCQRLRGLWHHRWVRLMDRHLPQLLSYMLLLSASNHSRCGWYCIGLLLPWRILGDLWHRFRAQSDSSEALTELRSLHQFAKRRSSDDHCAELVQMPATNRQYIEITDDEDEDADAVPTRLNRSDRNLYSNRSLQQLPRSI
ncbi:uncharacterized protein LOC6562625 [Drosophila grimshawi]|nr:uncharacterized protein LOC6562625 [Drosophila grimshawi]